MLTVDQMTGQQLGQYNCSVHNRFGGAFATITLTQPDGKSYRITNRQKGRQRSLLLVRGHA